MNEDLPLKCINTDLACPFRTNKLEDGYCLICAAKRGDGKHGKTSQATELWYTNGYGAPCNLIPPQCQFSTHFSPDQE